MAWGANSFSTVSLTICAICSLSHIFRFNGVVHRWEKKPASFFLTGVFFIKDRVDVDVGAEIFVVVENKIILDDA